MGVVEPGREGVRFAKANAEGEGASLLRFKDRGLSNARKPTLFADGCGASNDLMSDCGNECQSA